MIDDEDEYLDPCDFFEDEEEGDFELDPELHEIWMKIVATKRNTKIKKIFKL